MPCRMLTHHVTLLTRYDAYDQSKYAPNLQQVIKRYGISDFDILRPGCRIRTRLTNHPLPQAG